MNERVLFLRFLLSLRPKPNETLSAYFVRFDGLIIDLRNSGVKMEELDVVNLFMTLPSEYDSVITSLSTLRISEKTLSLDIVKASLIDYESKCKANSSEEKSAPPHTAFQVDRKVSCKYCKKDGHLIQNCFKLKNKDGQKSNVAESQKKKPSKPNIKKNETPNSNVAESSSGERPFSFLTYEVEAEGEALFSGNSMLEGYLDSGATSHMLNERVFSELVPLNPPVKINIAKEEIEMEAVEIGTVKVMSADNVGELKNVYYVPKLHYNLFSVNQMDRAGYAITFSNQKVYIYRENKLVASGVNEHGLYKVIFHITHESVNFTDGHSKYELWHRRLYHIGKNGMKSLISAGVLGDSLRAVDGKGFSCSACFEGKQSKNLHKFAHVKAKRPLELIHSDVCGPITPILHDKDRYYVSFTDDFTRFSVIYFMQHKSEVVEKFKNYCAMVTSQFGCGMKISHFR